MAVRAAKPARTYRWLLPALVVIALLAAAPSLNYGLFMDDMIHRSILLKSHPLRVQEYYGSDSHSLRCAMKVFFAWILPGRSHLAIEYGTFPWWTDPQLRVAFWRPLAAATHWADYQLWPNHPELMHLQSMGWFCALVAVLFALYRRIIGPGWMAGLAALLYAVKTQFFWVVAWIAARNALMSAFFVVLTVALHHRSRESRSAGLTVGSAICLAAGLFCSESAVAALAYLVSYAIFLDRDRWSRRLLSLAPAFSAVALWRGVYQHLGYGASRVGSGFYIDPGTDISALVAAVAKRLPILLFDLCVGPTLPLNAVLSTGMQEHARLAAVVLLVVLGVALWFGLRNRRAAGFWALGMVLAVIPGCASASGYRVLLASGRRFRD